MKRAEPALIHRATTREELDAVYRFRYDIYYREFGRLLGRPDHERRQVRDDADERGSTTILFTGTPDHITATVRLQHWRAGEVPARDLHELSIDRVPGSESLACGEIGRLMVRPSRRGHDLVSALVDAAYDIFVGDHGTRLVFCYCSPGLTHFYRRIAMRPYGGRLVAAPDGLMIPLVSVTSDAGYYRRVGSFLAPKVGVYFGPGKLKPTELRPLRPAFDAGGLELERRAIELAVEPCLRQAPGSFLAGLDRVSRRALMIGASVVDVEPGLMVTREGFREEELYVVLDGEVATPDTSAKTSPVVRRAGQYFGEESILGGPRRHHTWRCRTRGRLLVLSGRAVRKVLRRRPELLRARHAYEPQDRESSDSAPARLAWAGGSWKDLGREHEPGDSRSRRIGFSDPRPIVNL